LIRIRETTVLRMDKVGLSYGQGPEILKNVNLTLQPQSFHFLTGPSGSGKTSLLRLMFLGLKPTRGLVKIFERDVNSLTRPDILQLRRRIGVVFQEFRLLDHLSVFENVALPLRVAGQNEDKYRQDVSDLIEWVGLKHHTQSLPPVLSGGEKQRVAIARAVVNKPDIILADEPTGNVDPALGRRLLHLFMELNRGGTTVFIASHDETLIAQAGKRVLQLREGRLQ
jgi:cell division transport system ATP-binding protein